MTAMRTHKISPEIDLRILLSKGQDGCLFPVTGRRKGKRSRGRLSQRPRAKSKGQIGVKFFCYVNAPEFL
jgi:hypothetical protein